MVQQRLLVQKHVILIVVFLLFVFKVYSQQFNKSINKDSLVKVIAKDLTENRRKEFLKSYEEGDEQTKEFLLFMFSMPHSSKAELIKNINTNYGNVNILKTEYLKLVPRNFIVSIEFNPGNEIISTKESVDLSITLVKGKEKSTKQEWNLEYTSPKLNKMLATLNWTNKTLSTIKKLLADAHCISIVNSQRTNIGFARSGLGKYSYLLFDDNLTPAQIKQFNDGCEYIFYKNNIVLEYGGGATGPQCFPDR